METVKLFRYVRANEINLQRMELEDKPTGGIAFYFEIDQGAGNLYWASVICRDDENFNYKLSQKIAKGRFLKTGTYCWCYDRNISLVENVVNNLNWLSITNTIGEYELTLRSKLKSILKQNKRNQEFLDSIKQNIKNNIDLYK